MLACLSSVVRKVTTYPYGAVLARSPFVLTEHISSIQTFVGLYSYVTFNTSCNWRKSEASEIHLVVVQWRT